MSLAQDNADYSVSGPFTGDALIFDLALTGWGNVLATYSVGGVMFWGVDASNVLSFYSDAARSNLVCSGTISASDRVTLAENAGNGISGTCGVTHTAGLASTGRVVIAYGDEPDLEDVLQDSSDFLTSSQWRGVNRFEKAFRIAKRELDAWIIGSARSEWPTRRDGSFDLSLIATPFVYRRVHALLAASTIIERRGSFTDGTGSDMELAATYVKRARELFRGLQIQFETGENGIVSFSRGAASGKFGRR